MYDGKLKKIISSLKEIRFVDEKISHFNEMSFVATKLMQNQ